MKPNEGVLKEFFLNSLKGIEFGEKVAHNEIISFAKFYGTVSWNKLVEID